MPAVRTGRLIAATALVCAIAAGCSSSKPDSPCPGTAGPNDVSAQVASVDLYTGAPQRVLVGIEQVQSTGAAPDQSSVNPYLGDAGSGAAQTAPEAVQPSYSSKPTQGNDAGTIPLGLSELNAQKRLAYGDRVVLTAFGAGFTSGAIYLRWAIRP